MWRAQKTMYIAIIIMYCTSAACSKEVNTSKIIFKEAGEVLEANTVLHVTLELDFNQVGNHCNYLQEMARQVDQQLPDNVTTPAIRRGWDNNKASINQTCTAVHDLIPKGRARRQILEAAMLLGGTAFGLYTETQIHQIQGDARVRDHRLLRVENDLRRQTRALDTAILKLDQLRWWIGWSQEIQTHLHQFDHQVEMLTQGVHEAITLQRLSSKLIPLGEAQRILEELRRQAQGTGGSIPFQRANQIYQLPTSTTVVEGKYRLVCHVPLVTTRLRLWKHLSVPISIHMDDGSESLMELGPGHDYLAINSQVHQEMTAAALADCWRWGRSYVCRHLGSLRRIPQDSCLGALFNEHRAHIRTLCEWHPLRREWAVEPLAEEHVFAFFNASSRVLIQCVNGTTQNLHIHRFGVFELGSGCSASNDRFVLHGQTHLSSQVHVAYPVEWIWPTPVAETSDSPEESEPMEVPVDPPGQWAGHVLERAGMWIIVGLNLGLTIGLYGFLTWRCLKWYRAPIAEA